MYYSFVQDFFLLFLKKHIYIIFHHNFDGKKKESLYTKEYIQKKYNFSFRYSTLKTERFIFSVFFSIFNRNNLDEERTEQKARQREKKVFIL